MKIAIIGSGISGISSAYYLLKLIPNCKIVFYEKEKKLGGHSYTYEYKEDKIDLGFQVFNKFTYPNLINFFDELEIEYLNTDMTFYTRKISSNNIFLSFRNLDKFNLLVNILHFYFYSENYIKKYEKSNKTINKFCQENNYNENFKNFYLIPIASCIWSSDIKFVEQMPIYNILLFFKNHKLLNYYRNGQWLTLKNRSTEYIEKVMTLYKDRIEIIHQKIDDIEKIKNDFDHIIISIHGSDVKNIVKKKYYHKIFDKVKYSKSICFLHQDTNLMPSQKNTWNSWNFIGNNKKFICTYWCNNLQKNIKNKNLFFTLNYPEIPDNMIHQITFEHPVYNNELVEFQKEADEIQGINNIWYTGAYFGYGFHEDGITSALKVVKKITNQDIKIFEPNQSQNFFSLLIQYLIIFVIKIIIRNNQKINLILPNFGFISFGNKKNKNKNKNKRTYQVKNPLKFLINIYKII